MNGQTTHKSKRDVLYKVPRSPLQVLHGTEKQRAALGEPQPFGSARPSLCGRAATQALALCPGFIGLDDQQSGVSVSRPAQVHFEAVWPYAVSCTVVGRHGEDVGEAFGEVMQ